MKTLAVAFGTPPQDEHWLKTSISGDRFEIAGGQIALARSHNPKVRALARRLMRDHTKSLNKATKLAKLIGVPVPHAATPLQQWALQQLRSVPTKKFDATYAGLEVKDHTQDVEETGEEARRGEKPKVVKEAKKDLPVLEVHLGMAKNVLKGVT